MKKRYCFILYLIFSWIGSFSQENKRFKKNAISINALAFTRLYSLNYERVLSHTKTIYTSNVGVYYLPVNQSTKNVTAIYAGMDFLRGKKTHYLDLGFSFVFDKRVNLSDIKKNVSYIT